MLKPNAGRVAPPHSGTTTDARVVQAAIDAFVEMGAEVSIGESPILGVDALEALTVAGIRDVAEAGGCRLLDLDARRYQSVPVPDGAAIQSLKVCREVLAHELVVSMPVMKTHMHTGVSLSVKNMKGCLWGRSKVAFHMLPPVENSEEKPIDIAIADMSGVLRPHLAIIDGTVGMEGLGPSAGEPKRLDVVVAGTDPFAADAVACALMGIDPASVPHLRIGAARGHGTIDLAEIEVRPHDWRQWASKFSPPLPGPALKLPNVRVLDRNSCSACQSSLYLFLKRYGEVLASQTQHSGPLHIAIGKGHEDLPEGTLCLGNCAVRRHRRETPVGGCPPVASEILRVLYGRPTVDAIDGHGGSSAPPAEP